LELIDWTAATEHVFAAAAPNFAILSESAASACVPETGAATLFTGATTARY
jgi:hypothetical protein